MPSHRSHGRQYIEPPRHDELPDGVPAQPLGEAGSERRPDGTLAQGARTIPSLGGKAQKGRTSLSHKIATESLALPAAYAKRARSFCKAARSELARDVGGGDCGVVASAMVRIASIQMALAEKALDEGRDADASRFGEAARNTLNYAREHAAKAAKARPRAPVDPLAQWRKPPPPKVSE